MGCGQDLFGGPAGLDRLGDGGNQSRPGGVSDDACAEVVAEQHGEVTGPGRPQGGGNGGAARAQVAGLREQRSGRELPGQPPPQCGGGHLVRQWRGRAGDCAVGAGVSRAGAPDQRVDVDAGAVCGGEPVGEHGPVGVGEQPGFELLGQGAPAVRGRRGVAERAGDPGAQGVLLAGVGGGQPSGAGGGQVVVRDVVGGSPDGEVGEQVAGAVGAEQRRSPGRALVGVQARARSATCSAR